MDWVSRFGISIEERTTYTEQEKRDYLIQVISNILVHQTENKEGHILEIFFSQPIVKDKLKYNDPNNKRKGYKVINGSKNKEVSIKSKRGGRPKKTPPVELIQQSLTLPNSLVDQHRCLLARQHDRTTFEGAVYK